MTPAKTRANVGERVNAESSAGVVIMIVIAVVLWGSAPAGIRVALAGYRPAQLSLLRFGIASVLLAVYAAFAGLRLPDKRGLVLADTHGWSWNHVLQHHSQLWAW
jgi:drug/metabolite transporter (DMT)-like permease